MNKKYVIAIAVLIVVWVGFMAYRHYVGKQEGDDYRAKEHSRITVGARQSARAGLGQMGRALQKYYEENRAYPSSLEKLYPKYVGNKSFIDEIDWYYEPKGDNFYLSKTVVRDNKRMMASLDKGLTPRVETGVMVATPTPAPGPAEVRGPEGPVVEKAEISVRSREEFWEALRLRQKGDVSAYLAKRDRLRIVSAMRPEVVSVVQYDVSSSVETELSQKYLVWKDRGGILGFGNVEYPASGRQNIYAMGSWYDVKVPLRKEEGPTGAEAGIGERKEGPEMIASNLGERYLVWKGQQGVLGFGNVEYPQRDRVSVYQTDGWVNIERPAPPVKIGKEEEYESQKGKSAETVASELSSQYFVWKDEQVLGFGNVGYPARDRVSVYQTDGWVNIERPAPPAEAGKEEEYKTEEGKSAEVAPELSARHLVWKDQDGTLGFGNVEYPETKNISHVHVRGSWEKVIN
ncbi:MAG: hypothetical protein ABUK14_01740 [Desulfobacteria bacterium]